MADREFKRRAGGLPPGVGPELTRIADQIREAVDRHAALQLVGGRTKSFYGREAVGEPLDLTAYAGVVSYEPSELVVTAKAGTRIEDLAQVLASKDQMLGFEPPCFAPGGTLGGAVAAGLAGPRRPYAGAVRDFVLGVAIIDGTGESLRFGGQVMKNVAGYDVSRLMVGALGTLGAIVEVSIRVIPVPVAECTFTWQCDGARAADQMIALAGQPWPISAMSYDGAALRVRLSGSVQGIAEARQALAPEAIEDLAHWSPLRDHGLAVLHDAAVLWRLSLPPAAPAVPLAGDLFIDWGGAQRWLGSDDETMDVWDRAREAGGHATRFRGGDRDQVFTPLAPANRTLQQRLKAVFDPHAVLNPGRMYAGL
jgi:glycolate oxidase FAD binding subunit